MPSAKNSLAMAEVLDKTPKPGCLLRIIAWAVLCVVVPLLLLLAAEGGLRLAGFGHSTRFVLEKKADDGARFYVPNRAYYQQFSLLPIDAFLNWDHLDFLVEKDKAPGVFRIFAFGGSAIYGTYSPPRLLDVMLDVAYPDMDTEVFNAACPGMNSHVMAPAAQAAEALQPDCYVIYMGNNEATGPYGPSTALARLPFFWRVPVIRGLIALHNWRLFQLVQGPGPDPGEKPDAEALQHMQPHVTNDPRANAQYRMNLEDMCGYAAEAGADTVVSTLARNWRFGVPEQAMDAPDPEHYEQGKTNEAVVDTAAARDGVYLVDAERLLMEAAADGVPDYAFFVDNIHFNFHGSYLVAREFFAQVSAILVKRGVITEAQVIQPPTEEDCATMLGFEAPARYDLITQQLNVVVDPPSRALLEAEMARLRGQFEGHPKVRRREDLERAVALRPEDWRLRFELIEQLQAAGDHEAALKQGEILLKQQPHLRVALRVRAQTLMAVGEVPQAKSALQALLKLYPDDPAGRSLEAMWAQWSLAS